MSTTTTTTTRVPTADAMPAGGVTAAARLLGRLATVRVWVVSTVVYSAFAGVFFASSAPFSIPRVEEACGQAPPDLRFGPSAAEVHGFLDACGPVGREAYRALQLADLVYPTVFAVFLASSLALALRLLAPGRPRLLILAAIPFAAAAFDYLENVGAWLALTAYPLDGAADGLLGPASVAKTSTSWVAGGLLVAVLLALAVDRARRHLARPSP